MKVRTALNKRTDDAWSAAETRHTESREPKPTRTNVRRPGALLYLEQSLVHVHTAMFVFRSFVQQWKRSCLARARNENRVNSCTFWATCSRLIQIIEYLPNQRRFVPTQDIVFSLSIVNGTGRESCSVSMGGEDLRS